MVTLGRLGGFRLTEPAGLGLADNPACGVSKSQTGVEHHSSAVSLGSQVPGGYSTVFRCWVWFLEGPPGKEMTKT